MHNNMFVPASLGMSMGFPHGGSFPTNAHFAPNPHAMYYPPPPSFALSSLHEQQQQQYQQHLQHAQYEAQQKQLGVPAQVLQQIDSSLSDSVSSLYRHVMSTADTDATPSSPSAGPTKAQLEQTNKLHTVRTLEKLVRAEMDLLLQDKTTKLPLSESRRATRRQVLTITLRREIRRSGGRTVASLLRTLAETVDSRLKQVGVAKYLGSVRDSLSDSFEGLRPTKPRQAKASTDTSRSGAGIKRGLDMADTQTPVPCAAASSKGTKSSSAVSSTAVLATTSSADVKATTATTTASPVVLLSSLVSSSPFFSPTTTSASTTAALPLNPPFPVVGHAPSGILPHHLASAGQWPNFPAI
jgi:hypothetical protein